MQKLVFSDVDGTLLTSDHRITERTKEAIAALKQRGIPFTIVSARSPSGIMPIVEEIGLPGGFGPIVAYSGGLILGEDGTTLFSRGMEKSLAGEIVAFVEQERFPAAWCLYSYDQWVVRDKNDPKVIEEEQIVKAQAEAGSIDTVRGDVVHKILCICEPGHIDEIERRVKARFPQCAVVQSWITQLEIMPGGVNKGLAVKELCARKGIAVGDTAAFGDNYNDVEMLLTAGRGYIMENAPQDLKQRGFYAAKSNNEDGIYHALKELEWI